MSSTTREIVHDQHTHPTRRFYLYIGAGLLLLTVLEILGYVGETKGVYASGTAAILILILSGIKFFMVVAYFMHLKFDNKLFTGIFAFPALLGTLVIVGCIMLFHVVHGVATEYHANTPADAQHVSGGPRGG
jgi:cytochrome c oxidase subunit 4